MILDLFYNLWEVCMKYCCEIPRLPEDRYCGRAGQVPFDLASFRFGSRQYGTQQMHFGSEAVPDDAAEIDTCFSGSFLSGSTVIPSIETERQTDRDLIRLLVF